MIYPAVKCDVTLAFRSEVLVGRQRVRCNRKSVAVSTDDRVSVVVALGGQLVGVLRADEHVLAFEQQAAQREAVRHKLKSSAVVGESDRSEVGHAGRLKKHSLTNRVILWGESGTPRDRMTVRRCCATVCHTVASKALDILQTV